MSDQPKFPAAEARAVANEVLARLTPFCDRTIIAGSLRRLRSRVSDIEILFIPRMVAKQATLFGAPEMCDLMDLALSQWVMDGYLKKRPNVEGSPCWGVMNKLAVHVASGIPIDFFATIEKNWWNSLVVRTGGKKSNLALTMAANKLGYRFEAYGSGFQKIGKAERHESTSEADIFRFARLRYFEPQFRS